jgi:putative intracellular protease/amidase
MKLPHKSNVSRKAYNLKSYKAVIITTSQATLDKIDQKTATLLKVGKPTGVYASEMTEPYYTFLDAQMEVDISSIKGGKIPIEKLSLQPLVRTKEDRRFLKDPVFQEKVSHSKSISEINIEDYDIVFLSGGWGAAYDFAQSDKLGFIISQAYASKTVLGAVCHGALGFIGATKPDGSALVENVNITAVTNKQLKELMVGNTPKHPETELKNANANYEYKSGLIDMFKSHIVVDKKHLIVTGQNQKGGIEAAQSALVLLKQKISRKAND